MKFHEMNYYVNLATAVGGTLGTEGFMTMKEAREYISRELLPILDAGDVLTITENDASAEMSFEEELDKLYGPAETITLTKKFT